MGNVGGGGGFEPFFKRFIEGGLRPKIVNTNLKQTKKKCDCNFYNFLCLVPDLITFW